MRTSCRQGLLKTRLQILTILYANLSLTGLSKHTSVGNAMATERAQGSCRDSIQDDRRIYLL